MIRSATAAFALNLILALPAYAEAWRDGVGQGVGEAWVDKGPGNRIYVACGYGTNSISFTLAGKSPEPGSTVTLIFDAKDPIEITNYEGKFAPNCNPCRALFELVEDELKSSNSVYVRFSAGVGTRFSLKGAAKAIGDGHCPFEDVDPD